MELGMKDGKFPKEQAASATNSVPDEDTSPAHAPCGCLKHGPPLCLLDRLPFRPVKENIPIMKGWILRHWAARAFNNCHHKELPLLKSTPMRNHIEPE